MCIYICIEREMYVYIYIHTCIYTYVYIYWEHLDVERRAVPLLQGQRHGDLPIRSSYNDNNNNNCYYHHYIIIEIMTMI